MDDSDNYSVEDNSEDDKDKSNYTSSPNKGVTSSVQEFLKQSNEIQEEIRKLSELCQQISPKKDSFIEEAPREKEDFEGDHVVWEQINNLLTTHGFAPLTINQDDYDQDYPDPSSAQDTLVELITEYSNLSRNFEELNSSYKELEEEYKAKCLQAEKNKGIEEKIRNLDKINRQLQEKLAKQQENFKSREEKVVNQKIKTFGERPVSIFKAFMDQDYNPLRDNDAKIMAIIQNYEEQVQKLLQDLQSSRREVEGLNSSFKKLKEKSVENDQSYQRPRIQKDDESQEKLKVLQNVVSQLSLKSYLEIPNALHKIQQVMMTLPGIDKFVKQICEEIMISPGSRLEEVIESLKELKRKVIQGEKFRNNVFDQLNASSENEVLDKIKGFMYFCKLFEIRPREDVIASVESIFFFVHEIKMFLAVRSI
jgi:hypothetical protein